MHTLAAELLKFRRSTTWLIAVILPLLAVVTGALNYAGNQGVLTAGWESLLSQVTIFYGLFFCAVGVSILVAVTWRSEHRGGSWNLTATSVGVLRLLAAKVAAMVPLLLAMQLTLIAGVLVAGVVLQLPGRPPLGLALVPVLGVVGALPVAAFQSVLSALTRSFAVPVAVGFLAVFGAIMITTSEALRPLAWVTPQALLTRAVSVGSVALANAGGIEEALPLTGSALGLTVVITVLGAAVVRWWRFR